MVNFSQLRGIETDVDDGSTRGNTLGQILINKMAQDRALKTGLINQVGAAGREFLGRQAERNENEAAGRAMLDQLIGESIGPKSANIPAPTGQLNFKEGEFTGQPIQAGTVATGQEIDIQELKKLVDSGNLDPKVLSGILAEKGLTAEGRINKLKEDQAKAQLGLTQAKTQVEQAKTNQQFDPFVYGDYTSPAQVPAKSENAVTAKGSTMFPMDGLKHTQKLASWRGRIKNMSSKQKGDLEDVLINSDQLLVNFGGVADEAARVREKYKDDIQSLIKAKGLSTKGVREIIQALSSSNNPDLVQLGRFLNTTEAYATKVAKSFGEERVSDMDARRFIALMGNPSMSNEEFQQQLKDFKLGILYNGLKSSAIVGHEAIWKDFNDQYKEIVGQGFNFDASTSETKKLHQNIIMGRKTNTTKPKTVLDVMLGGL